MPFKINPQWRNFAITAVIIIAIFSLLILLQWPAHEEEVEKTFLEKYSELAKAWKSNGVESERLHEAFPELLELSDEKLGKIQAGLEKHKHSDDKRIASLAGAYIDYVEFIPATREHSKMLETIKQVHDKNTCETFSEYEKLNETTEKIITLASNYSAKTYSFTRNHPKETGEIALEETEFDQDLMIEQLNKQKGAAEYFKEECANE